MYVYACVCAHVWKVTVTHINYFITFPQSSEYTNSPYHKVMEVVPILPGWIVVTFAHSFWAASKWEGVSIVISTPGARVVIATPGVSVVMERAGASVAMVTAGVLVVMETVWVDARGDMTEVVVAVVAVVENVEMLGAWFLS